MSNRFSPSTMFERAWPPRALAMTLLTSEAITPQALALDRIDAELEVRLSTDMEDADVFDAPDFLQSLFGLGGQRPRADRDPGR